APYIAEARDPPPHCHSGNHEAILNDLEGWAKLDTPDDCVRWLYGPAGAGKSAISQTSAE
ncbi:hypothetical protein BDP27DRAFT_1186771, partial [Rhodocollybia butyracea]